MGLADRAKSKLEELSHGNQQRIQLATALVHDPELLVMDEPFSGLDPIGIATMTEVVRERAAAGVGVVFSSHQLDLVEDVCEDVVIIARGRVVAAGRIEDLKAAAGRRHLDIEVDGSDGSWVDGRADLTVLERSGGRLKLLVDDRVDLDTLLDMAKAAGTVRRFAYGPPRLSELFMAYVTPRRARRSSGMSRATQHLARRAAGDHRASPQPRLRPVGRLHDAVRRGLVRRAHDPLQRRRSHADRDRPAGAREPRGDDRWPRPTLPTRTSRS